MRKYIFLVFSIINFGCTNRQPEQLVSNEPIIARKNRESSIFKTQPLNIKEYITIYKVGYKSFGSQNDMDDANTYDLNIHELEFQNARVFVYKYEFSKNDTLEIYSDSIKFNGVLVNKISSKRIKQNNGNIVINKYFYAAVGENTLSASNLYINPALGLIIQNVVSQKSGIVEYKKDLEGLQKQIKQDLDFFQFKERR